MKNQPYVTGTATSHFDARPRETICETRFGCRCDQSCRKAVCFRGGQSQAGSGPLDFFFWRMPDAWDTSAESDTRWRIEGVTILPLRCGGWPRHKEKRTATRTGETVTFERVQPRSEPFRLEPFLCRDQRSDSSGVALKKWLIADEKAAYGRLSFQKSARHLPTTSDARRLWRGSFRRSSHQRLPI